MEVAGYIVVDSTEKQRGQFQQCEGEDLQHKRGSCPRVQRVLVVQAEVERRE
jgi:hypothetical protein